MRFVRIIKNCNHLWAVKDPEKDLNELTELFSHWNNAEYLLDFFTKNFDDLKGYFHIERISVTDGAIKLTRTMQEREHTMLELTKLNQCKAFLKANGVFDGDSFVELTNDL